jgi:hypothetical protein
MIDSKSPQGYECLKHMGIFPITPLVREVQGLILQTFDVSEREAQDYAAELVALAEGWGSPETAAQLDWSYRIRKDLGETKGLKWRSEQDRAKFEAVEKQKYADWDAFIRSPRQS